MSKPTHWQTDPCWVGKKPDAVLVTDFMKLTCKRCRYKISMADRAQGSVAAYGESPLVFAKQRLSQK